LVHAHPDDESITTGATMACYAASGARVTLLTCTLGEEGEILVPELTGLAADQGDQLGGYRMGELAAAMAALGVRDHRFLGGAGRFRDSGMMGAPANSNPRAFWRAADDPAVFAAAVDAAVAVIREVRPQVVVTYDPNGDYGHPDHIMAHRVTMAAVVAAADPRGGGGAPWQVSKVYWVATPRSVLRRELAAMAEAAPAGFTVARVEDLPFGVDDSLVTTVVDATGFGAAKLAALRAHATQIAVDGPFFALSNKLGREALAVEHFRLAWAEPELGLGRLAWAEPELGLGRGDSGGPSGPAGRETDLFAGLADDGSACATRDAG